MNNWQYIGALLTGVAALITAGIGVYDKLLTVNRELYRFETTKKIKREYGVVEDKDGWVYLREKPNVESAQLAKILNGTNLEIIGSEGNWVRVYTESGREGYVYRDRLLITQYENN
jgi:uncharacterized protein YgiM (DUF1202 family)